ncbi:Agamous-like MADS-box protein AGL80 [Dichanthelium oligosanthes]|uniref:Agamous-like MADS-box protein AGL80 n=1 Tax=Dichanthelium oligosanthes TaxID=888268 RepID=A0A1E5VN01_9POAL|nr:Agamous-like MADS-box protein AGL80 [Dichanthelium oligosanthes]
MARKRVNLQWITNSSTRRATYKKRCKVLMKKTSELVTLCGAKACVVVYGEGETQPEVWPSVSEAKRVVKKFKDMPEVGKFKKMQSQDDFLHGRISKLHDQVCKLDRENREIETRDLLYESMDGRRPGLEHTTIEELTSLSQMVETKMAKVKERLQQLAVGQGSLPNQPALFSSQSQASYAYPEVQTLAGLVELQPLQQGRPTDLVPNGGELDAVIYGAFVGSSSGCISRSSYGCDKTQL